MSRFTLRRGFQPSTWKHDPKQQVRFGELRNGDYFALTPPGTTRLAFVKVGTWGAQIDDPANDSGYPDQSFQSDTMVYLLARGHN